MDYHEMDIVLRKSKSCIRVATGHGKVREILGQRKVMEF